MRTFNVGILGCGVISRTYAADIKAFFPRLNIVACADVNLALAEKLAREFDIPKACLTEDLLKDEAVEIVVNLTPPQLHVALGRQIIASGKHLFSEKPFAQSLREAEELMALAKAAGVQVGCAPDIFLGSGLQSLRWYLDRGLIGKPFFVTANMTTFGYETWHPNVEPFYREGSGPLYDMAPYYLSAIVTLLGPIESIAAFSARGLEKRRIYAGARAGSDIIPEIPTHYTAILRLVNGTVANLNVSFDIYRSNLPMLEIYGDGGTLTYPDPNFSGGAPRVYRREQYIDPLFRDTDEARALKETFRELPELFPRPKDYSRGVGVMDLATAIDSGKPNRAGGKLATHITEAINGLIESAETGAYYRMTTACERPEPLTPGTMLGEI